MIDKISMQLSVVLKRKFPNGLPELETINYVHKFFISNVIPIVLILLIALSTGSLASVALSLFGFAFLRLFSGGLHLKSVAACAILSAVVVFIIPLLGEIMNSYTHLLIIITAIIVSIYAPSNIRKQTRIPEKYFIHLKIISILIVVSNLLIESSVLAVAYLVQAVTLIRLKGGEKK